MKSAQRDKREEGDGMKTPWIDDLYDVCEQTKQRKEEVMNK